MNLEQIIRRIIYSKFYIRNKIANLKLRFDRWVTKHLGLNVRNYLVSRKWLWTVKVTPGNNYKYRHKLFAIYNSSSVYNLDDVIGFNIWSSILPGERVGYH
jgi:hypothetical protein